MVDIRGLVAVAFLGSIGMTLVILGSVLYDKWWPFFVVLFYILVPVPTAFAKRHLNSMGDGTGGTEFALFLTLSLIISSFALPIVLSHAAVIAWQSCLLTLCGNVVVYATLLVYFLMIDSDDGFQI
ncbi:leptin receptor gene-related protein [Culicoides brevitarsis]|uniref:leptin receptor gene-related protein n=1 Tax=Culicoides brevitarsis TaxID=469753 RepID=UPI00307BE3FF